MEQPFRDFAKAYLRYRQSFRETVTATDTLHTLRLIYKALREDGEEPCVLRIDGRIIDRTSELIYEIYGDGRAYHLGGKFKGVLNFLRDNNINPRLPAWENHFPRPLAKARRTDEEALAWQEKRCPSLHQMIAVADMFSMAVEPVDLYWSC
jgi:hypothetical protein